MSDEAAKNTEEYLNVRVRSATGGLPFFNFFRNSFVAPSNSSFFSSLTICRLLFRRSSEEVYFKIKKATALKKLMAAYCSRENLIPNSVRFMFAVADFFPPDCVYPVGPFRLDGTRVNPTDTPAQLEMEDGDMIDAEVEQTGGF
jgi:small ubiquitin-related modifier